MTFCQITLPTKGLWALSWLSAYSLCLHSHLYQVFWRSLSYIPKPEHVGQSISSSYFKLEFTPMVPFGWLVARGSPGQWQSLDLRQSVKTPPESSNVQRGCVLTVLPGWRPRRHGASQAQMGSRCGLHSWAHLGGPNEFSSWGWSQPLGSPPPPRDC